MRNVEDIGEYEPKNGDEDIGPMSLTINTREH